MEYGTSTFQLGNKEGRLARHRRVEAGWIRAMEASRNVTQKRASARVGTENRCRRAVHDQ